MISFFLMCTYLVLFYFNDFSLSIFLGAELTDEGCRGHIQNLLAGTPVSVYQVRRSTTRPDPPSGRARVSTSTAVEETKSTALVVVDDGHQKKKRRVVTVGSGDDNAGESNGVMISVPPLDNSAQPPFFQQIYHSFEQPMSSLARAILRSSIEEASTQQEGIGGSKNEDDLPDVDHYPNSNNQVARMPEVPDSAVQYVADKEQEGGKARCLNTKKTHMDLQMID